MNKERLDVAQELIRIGKVKVDTSNGCVYTLGTNGLYTERTSSGKSPYLQIAVRYCGKKFTFGAHELVVVASGQDLLNKEVNHLNGNKRDNRIDNLEVCSRSHNMNHMYRMALDRLLGRQVRYM